MPAVDCLVVHEGRLLMMHPSEASTPATNLTMLGGPVGHGESPLEACLRRVAEETGLHIEPSCAAAIFETTPEATDFRLAFVAEAPARELRSLRPGSLEWVTLTELSERADITELDRLIIPKVLASGVPLAIFIDLDTTHDPITRTLREISTIGLARLSPLVFAVTT